MLAMENYHPLGQLRRGRGEGVRTPSMSWDMESTSEILSVSPSFSPDDATADAAAP